MLKKHITGLTIRIVMVMVLSFFIGFLVDLFDASSFKKSWWFIVLIIVTSITLLLLLAEMHRL